MPSLTAPYQNYGSKSVWTNSGFYLDDATVSGSLQQLSRIQSLDWAVRGSPTDMNYIDAGVETYNALPNGVDVTYSWKHHNARNEWYLGLTKINSNGTLSLGWDLEKDAYIGTEDTQGADAIGSAQNRPRTVCGFGRGLITQYTLSAAVGGFIEASANVNYLSARTYTGSVNQPVPSVNSQNGNYLTGRFTLPVASSQYSPDSPDLTESSSALGAQEIMLMFPSNSPFAITYTGEAACYLQSFNLNIPIDRKEQKGLGYMYPSARPVIYPVAVNLDTEAIVSKYQSDELQRLRCCTSGHAVNIVVKQKCSNVTMFGFYLDGLQIDSQDITTSVGNMDRVRTSWRGWIKSPNEVFISPTFNYIYRDDTSGAYGTSW